MNIRGEIMGSTHTSEIEVIYRDFLRNNSNIIAQLTDALQVNDFKTAHRLAHTTKSLCAIMNEKSLKDISKRIEEKLRRDEIPAALEIQEFEREAIKLLEYIKCYLKNNSLTNVPKDNFDFDKTVAEEFLSKLEHDLTLKRGNVLDAIDYLQKIPNTDELIICIEDFEFGKALDELKHLRQKLGV
ncbi:MAG: Hpt domain-containing protein [Defluviitaleaceae bacterium]|nr:Hpt domain-containing protein [Defluviitaleaceae bacterium]